MELSRRRRRRRRPPDKLSPRARDVKARVDAGTYTVDVDRLAERLARELTPGREAETPVTPAGRARGRGEEEPPESE
jgi:hypothetical protein